MNFYGPCIYNYLMKKCKIANKNTNYKNFLIAKNFRSWFFFFLQIYTHFLLLHLLFHDDRSTLISEPNSWIQNI